MKRILSTFMTGLILSLTFKPVMAADLKTEIKQAYRHELMRELDKNVTYLFKQGVDIHVEVPLTMKLLPNDIEIVQEKIYVKIDQDI